MDVRLSAEQQALRDAAAQMVERLGPKAVPDLQDPERPSKLDAAVEASGWRELRAAVEGRTPLASGVEPCLIVEEMGRGLADVAFLGPTLAADLRRLAGADPAPGPETVAMVPNLSALASAGQAAVAVDAAADGVALVVIPTGDRWQLATAAVGADGPAGGTDLTRRLRPVGGGEATPVAGAAPLGADEMASWTALGLALSAADLVGVMRGVLAISTDYARARRQYGTAIGSFQAVQHLLADALVAMEGSRSVALHAAWAVDALGPEEAVAAGAVAKAYCARAARAVCETGIQVHGGIGNTWDCLAHVYLRRALVSIDLLGGVGPNLARVLGVNGIGDADGLR